MMRAVSTIRAFAKTGLSISEIFNKTNQSLYENNDRNYFVTCWMAFLDLNSGVMEYVNAGHNPFVIKKKNGEVKLMKMKPFMFLGAFENINYQSDSVSLDKDDLIFVYTDGVTEANNKKRLLYGEENMLKVIKESELDPQMICENIKKSLDEFTRGTSQFDDITMMALSFHQKDTK